MNGENTESSLLHLPEVTFTNYRGFKDIRLTLHPELTVLYGENGAGKSNALMGIATLLAGLWRKATHNLDPWDAHEPRIQETLARQGAYPISLRARVTLSGARYDVERALLGPDGHTTSTGMKEIREAFSALLQSPSTPWPLLAVYGTERLHDHPRNVVRRRPKVGRRTDAWIDCLDPRSSEEQLLQWWFEASLPKFQRAPAPAFDAMARVLERAVPTAGGARLVRVEMEVSYGFPVMFFADGSFLRWSDLSDGYRAFLGLVCDLARRAWVLNAGLVDDPIKQAEGVVLIDELDQHMHPRWQLDAVPSLRAVFPKVQFVVTTHSPYVLASAKNDQVRHLSRGELVGDRAYVHGRDPNSVLAYVLDAPLRQPWAREKLGEIGRAIDAGDTAAARAGLDALKREWTAEDAEIARLEAFLGWEE